MAGAGGARPEKPRNLVQHGKFGCLVQRSLNVLRVISLFYLGQWNKEAFEFAHNYLWQGLIMLDVLVVWVMWVRWAVLREPGKPIVPFA